jgi:EmrB/QacA subfamily drug resistance transporter
VTATTTDAASPPPGTGTAAVSPRELRIIVASLMVGLFLSGLDSNIVATAMPTIAGKLGGFDKLTWVSTAYILTSTLATPLLGKLSDLFGRRLVYLVTITTFLVGSALCGAAGSINQLIAFRALQGVGGGGIMALSFAIIGDRVSPRERGKYIGVFTSAFALSSLAGPLAGGWIVDHTTWRWIFYVNIPIGIGVLIVTSTVLKLPFHRIDAKVDLLGAALMSSAIVSVLMGLELGSDHGWSSPEIIGLFVLGVVLTGAFWRQEQRASEPMIPPRLLRNRVVVVCCILGFLMGTTMYGASIYFSVFFQDVRFISPTLSGLMSLPIMIGVLVASTFAGRRISATGRYKLFPVVGLGVMSLGIATVAHVIGPSTGYARIGLGMLCIGGGMGFAMPTTSIASQNAVGTRDLGIATATVTFFRSLGGSVALAVYGTVFNSKLSQELAHRVPESSGRKGRDLATLIRAPKEIKALEEPLRRAVTASISAGVARVFLVALPFTLLAFLLSGRLPELPLRSTGGMSTVPVE